MSKTYIKLDGNLVDVGKTYMKLDGNLVKVGVDFIFDGRNPVNYVRFVSAEARTITPKYTNSGVTLEYSVNRGRTWTTIASDASTTSATEHWFRGQATGTKALFTGSNSSNAWAFSGSSDLEVYGNLNFLLCDTLGDEIAPTSLGSHCYSNMFRDCTSLTTAPELPATTLANYCYNTMFRDCTSLTTAPELPAKTLATYCYSNMFNGCTSLTVAPELPAKTLATYGYAAMFQNCTSLTTAPALPATVMTTGCYSGMFQNCTSLTTPPELPATPLANYCYINMFNGCISFKVSATNTGSYIYPWRIPTSRSGVEGSRWNYSMLAGTGGTFKSDPTINTTYYVENQPVSRETTKQWVYLYDETSEPAYQYYAYANINTTEEDWVDALEREFPARDLAVGTMGYVIAQNETDYHTLQVQEV